MDSEMAIEMAIELLQDSIGSVCAICDDYFGEMDNCDKGCERLKAFNLATAALRESDLHRWHDLNEYPGDLPPAYTDVVVRIRVTEKEIIHVVAYIEDSVWVDSSSHADLVDFHNCSVLDIVSWKFI